MSVAAQTNGTDTNPDSDVDTLHGWCQCIHAAAERCWTHGSHLSGHGFHELCHSESGIKRFLPLLIEVVQIERKWEEGEGFI